MLYKYDIEYLIELVENNLKETEDYIKKANNDFDIAMAAEGADYKKNLIKTLKNCLTDKQRYNII